MANDDVRLIAFYLPQFHPIPENDHWWGKGFTEWTNVTRARPLFAGHYQPHLPADLGFCDLRLAETRQAQADLAREYGIHGFCYYHYWFHGKRLLERPFGEVLRLGEPDLPFCLCWANEHWTKAWDCNPSGIIVEQKYSEEDDRNHLRWLLHAFRDPRYIRVNGKPLFLVYRAHDLPDRARTAAVWREEARAGGLEDLFLCKVECYDDPRKDPAGFSFDAAVEFQPDCEGLGPPLRRGRMWDLLRALGLAEKAFGQNFVCDYSTLMACAVRRQPPPYKRFPCVTPLWDNSARHKIDAHIFVGSTPGLYEQWLRSALRRAGAAAPGEKLVFINAWNEWAEGNHLEPDQRHGRAYLEATRLALENCRAQLAGSKTLPASCNL
jgi:lipopolysaccharide biosynthesis protein